MTIDKQGRYLATKITMMPRDTNPHGTIFGGVLLSHIDQSGAIGARYVDSQTGVSGLRAGHGGDEQRGVSPPGLRRRRGQFLLDTSNDIGRTSITVHVSVEAERDGAPMMLTEAEVTYVAVQLVDGERRPGADSRPRVNRRGSRGLDQTVRNADVDHMHRSGPWPRRLVGQIPVWGRQTWRCARRDTHVPNGSPVSQSIPDGKSTANTLAAD